MFKNLAPHDTLSASMHTADELERANITRVEVAFRKPTRPDVKSTYIGYLEFRDGTVATFNRHSTYWAVRLSAPLPYGPASELNKQWATEVRVLGMSGGDIVPPEGCLIWNVDSQQGLIELVRALMQHFGESSRSQRRPSIEDLARRKLLNSAIYG